MKSNLKHIFMKSFMIAAGITAGIIGVSLVAIIVTDLTTMSKTTWATGDQLDASTMSNITTNLNNIKTHLSNVNNLAVSTPLNSCTNGQMPVSDGAGGWSCGAKSELLIIPGGGNITFQTSSPQYFIGPNATGSGLGQEINLHKSGQLKDFRIYIPQNYFSIGAGTLGIFINHGSTNTDIQKTVSASFTGVITHAGPIPVNAGNKLSFYFWQTYGTVQLSISPIIAVYE